MTFRIALALALLLASAASAQMLLLNGGGPVGSGGASSPCALANDLSQSCLLEDNGIIIR